MKVALLHDAVGSSATADELDVVAQMDAVDGALESLGHSASRIQCTLNLELVVQQLRSLAPHLVFNLVESIGSQGRLIHLAPAVLDAAGFAYTGCPADAVYATSNKLLAKRLMQAAGIPTPEWLSAADLRSSPAIPRGTYMIKSVWEHASRGLDERSLISPDEGRSLAAELDSRIASLGGEGFCERYIDGREFNLSMLAGEVLPPAEIQFVGYEPERPRIVGYRAKWDVASFEYNNTPRRFEFPGSDSPLLAELSRLAVECWSTFGLRGYARVDFRVDNAGRPWVLEVNTNPCLSPDAGFAAAASQAGFSFVDVVSAILADTHDRTE